MIDSKNLSDQECRNLALDINQSFIVQAPAGSGKTELLAQRYLKLLSKSSQPESVLAITFTNKAANELKKRVIEHLQNAKLSPPKQQHQIQTFKLAKQALLQSRQQKWGLLENPSRMKISTIDSLASLVISKYPDIKQLIAPRVISEKYESEKFYKEAAKNTFKLLEEQEYEKDLKNVLLHLDNNVEKFYRLLINMLGKRDQWLTKLYKKGVAEVSILEETAQEIIKNHLNYLYPLAKEYFKKDFFEALKLNKNAPKNLPKPDINSIKDWHKIVELCLNKKYEWRKKVDKNQGFDKKDKQEKIDFINILNNLQTKENLKEALKDLSTLPDSKLAKKDSEIITSIIQVMKLASAELNILFEKNNAVDFIQTFIIALQKLDGLEGVNDIALFLDYKIEHLLIDEFQDTSYTQFNLIEKIISNWQQDPNKTLFLVGDPMQSIYRFRESEVGIFINIKEYGMAGIKLQYLQLKKNFRSIKSIVECNNKYFSQILPKIQNAETGAISYAESISHFDIKKDNAIKFHPFINGMRRQEAETVGDIIKTALKENDDEIAVLVNSRSHLNDIVQVLQENNINYEAIKTTALKSHLFTKDLLILARVLLSISDKLAWLAILRSPWCGILLKELLIFSDSEKTTIYHQLLDVEKITQLSEESLSRVKNLTNILDQAIKSMGQFSFVEVFNWALAKLSPKEYLDEQKCAIKSQFLKILSYCEEIDEMDIETIEYMLEELYAPSNNSRLKLMTIYQAKGLEFDVVIIPGLGRSIKSDATPLIALKTMANKNLLLAPIKSAFVKEESKSYTYLKNINNKQKRFEMMRLLYVAMSRAKKQLHLCGFIDAKKEAKKNSLLEFILPFFKNSMVIANNITNTEINKKNYTNNLLRYDVKELEKSTKTNTDITKNLEITKISELIHKQSLGIILHKFLENETFNPNEATINTKLLELGVPSKLREIYKQEIKKLLDNTKNDINAKWIFTKRDSTQVEVEFANAQQLIIVDRIFIENNTLWIIDFKTISPNTNENIEKFTARVKKEYQQQLYQYSDILSNVFTMPIKMAIYCPSLPQLIYL